MGFLKHLLFWPVTGPMYLTEFSLDKVRGVIKEELTDDSRVKEGLLDLQLRLELGEIDDEEYLREEARLMEEFREVRRWREEFGMATRGGVVQVGDAAEGASGPAPAGPGAEAPAGEPSGEPPPRPAEGPPTVPRGATLDISLDWDEDEARDEEQDGEDEEWSDGSSGGSTPASS